MRSKPSIKFAQKEIENSQLWKKVRESDQQKALLKAELMRLTSQTRKMILLYMKECAMIAGYAVDRITELREENSILKAQVAEMRSQLAMKAEEDKEAAYAGDVLCSDYNLKDL